MHEDVSTGSIVARFPPVARRTSQLALEKPAWIFKGHGSVLRFQPLLVKLAAMSGLHGEADSLEYFLSTHDAQKKIPYLLLIGSGETDAWNERTGAGLEAAVLLFEYKMGPRGTRVLSTADSTGRRNVLAPAECRAEAAVFAARRLVRQGAQVVRISFSETHRGSSPQPAEDVPAEGNSLRVITDAMRRSARHHHHGKWLLQEEQMPLYLPLLNTFDLTLAGIGQRTRSNLRYYRRRCEQEHGAVFVPEVRVTPAEFLSFSAECTYAVTDDLARWRYETLQQVPHSCLCGVRDRDGRWLSMAGLRRNGSYVELDWQMNRAHLASASLATVLRSYLIQHEVERGSTRLYIEGGTPQPIRHSFAVERVAELIVKRRSLYVRALEHSASRVFPAKNHLAQCLSDTKLEWNVW